MTETMETLMAMDPTLIPYWQGVCEGRVMIQRCAACGEHQFPPRPFCLACDAEAPTWVAASAKGRVYSTITSHLPPEPGRAVALVTLEEGPRLLAVANPSLAIGDPIRVEWETDTAGRPRLCAVSIGDAGARR